jgi:hypothetical protein
MLFKERVVVAAAAEEEQRNGSSIVVRGISGIAVEDEVKTKKDLMIAMEHDVVIDVNDIYSKTTNKNDHKHHPDWIHSSSSGGSSRNNCICSSTKCDEDKDGKHKHDDDDIIQTL